MPKLGPTELIIILLILVLLFGAPRLPKLARSLREARKEFEAADTEALKEGEKAKAKSEDAKKEETTG